MCLYLNGHFVLLVSFWPQKCDEFFMILDLGYFKGIID